MNSWRRVLDEVGSEIVGFTRVFYEFKGEVASTAGPLQIEFLSGTLLFDAGGDGESLEVSGTGWKDPFSGEAPLSEINKAYIEKSGKWTAFDMAHSDEYQSFFGAVVLSAVPRKALGDRLTGVLLKTTRGDIAIVAEWDELIVDLRPELAGASRSRTSGTTSVKGEPRLDTSEPPAEDQSQHVLQAKVLLRTFVAGMPDEEREAFNRQIDTITRLSGNLAFLSFDVDKTQSNPVPSIPNPLPHLFEVLADDGTSFGELMAWVDDEGYLDSLEYTWWYLATPAGLPAAERLRPLS